MLERISKTAAAAAVLLILGFLWWEHPDLTRPLRAAVAVAFLAGAGLAGIRRLPVHASFVLFAPLTPALARAAFGREGPVLELVWMAGLAGALVRTTRWDAWSLPPLWRPLAGGWALAMALAAPVLAAREAGFDARVLRDFGAVNSWAMWTAPQVVAWTLYWTLTLLLGVLWLDWLIRQLRSNPLRLPAAAHALWIGTTVASVVALIQGTVDLEWLNTAFWASRGRATGTMLDANSYGTCAALAGPFAFVAILSLRTARSGPLQPARSSTFGQRDQARLETVRVFAAWTALALNAIGMWMTGSRTALLCMVIGTGGLLTGIVRGRFAAMPRTRGRLLAAAAAVALIVVGVVAAGATGPVRRLAEISLTRNAVAQFRDRGGYGTIARTITREHPLVGTGAGSYHYLAPDYGRATTGDALQTDNAQNWWRHQLAEFGLVGAAGVLVLSALIAWRVFRGPAPPGLAGPTVRALLLGLGIISLVGVPTQNPVVLLWFYLLAGWLSMLVPITHREPGSRTARRGLWIAATALALAYAAGQFVLARGPLAVAERARRFGWPYVVGAYPPEPLETGSGEFRWTDEESRFVLPARTRFVVLGLWVRHPDVGRDPVQVSLSAPCGRVWDVTLSRFDPVTVGIELPDGLKTFDATVRVSRTWQPSSYGQEDRRRLGAAVVTDFVESRELARSQAYSVAWPPCG